MSNVIGNIEKQFLVNFMLHIAVFLTVLALSVVFNETNDLSILSAGIIAISPIIPVIFLLRLVVNHYRSLDEYIQRIMGESMLWAVGVVGCAAMAYGLLSEMVEVPAISPAFMLPAIALIFGVAQFIKLESNIYEE